MAADEEGWKLFSWSTLTMLIIVIIVFAGIYFGYRALSNTQAPGGLNTPAVKGDIIEVDYIGAYEDGTVFDTTFEEVATNDYLYPKSHIFELPDYYAPTSFNSETSDITILDFEMPALTNEIYGMTVGQTQTITLAPENGFGLRDESLVETINLTESFPIFTNGLNASEFTTKFGVKPSLGLSVIDPEYGWNASVYFVDESTDEVTLKHEPYVGEIIDFKGVWTSEVMSVDSSINPGQGEILVRHLIDSGDVNSLYGEDDGGEFLVTGYDEIADTATLDYNHEGAGRYLTFTVTLVYLG